MNVINFPICRHGKDGLHWYGGRGFNTKQKVIDTMSDKDWRRIVQWESHHAARKLLTEREPPNLPAAGPTSQPRANASPSYSVRAMSCTSADPAHRLSRFSFSLKEQ